MEVTTVRMAAVEMATSKMPTVGKSHTAEAQGEQERGDAES